MCKDNKEHTPRIADILAQLLQAQDVSELDVVHNSIMTLIKNDSKGKYILNHVTYDLLNSTWHQFIKMLNIEEKLHM